MKTITINSAEEKRIVKKVSRRILPFLILCFMFAYLDRANIGYAALEMNADLGLTNKMFGLVSGIFFLGYFIFEIPSNVLMERFGARKWIARILITWGLLAICTSLVQSANHLYFIRFLLGIAEAGFYPGVMLYLTYWFRSEEQASKIAFFTIAVPISYILGAPMSTLIMDNINWLGVSGWRWMFILEGVPPVILGVITYFYLTDKPKDAKWLTAKEKEWLISELEEERIRDMGTASNSKHGGIKSHLRALNNPRALYLAAIYFMFLTGSIGVGFWIPQIIQGFSTSLSNTQVGFIATIPYIVSTIVMMLWSKSSDRKNERKLHSAIPMFVAGISLAGAGVMTEHPVIAMTLITISLAGMYSFKGPFWAFPKLMIAPSALAVGLALINSLGNLGGFVGPFMLGIIQDLSKSNEYGLYFLSALLIISCFMMLFVKTNAKKVDNKDDFSNIKELEKFSEKITT